VLFILESLGTPELILIGIVALIFLGPRKLPEIARKIGKIMAEFRGTASEFKETWQREVNFEEEKKAFDLNALESDADESDAESKPVARVTFGDASDVIEPPAIKQIDPAEFESATHGRAEPANDESLSPTDKENWL
jgi:Tat protein translocase TatB subunit